MYFLRVFLRIRREIKQNPTLLTRETLLKDRQITSTIFGNSDEGAEGVFQNMGPYKDGVLLMVVERVGQVRGANESRFTGGSISCTSWAAQMTSSPMLSRLAEWSTPDPATQLPPPHPRMPPLRPENPTSSLLLTLNTALTSPPFPGLPPRPEETIGLSTSPYNFVPSLSFLLLILNILLAFLIR